MSTSKYFLVFYNSKKQNHIDLITSYIFPNNSIPIIPEYTEFISSGHYPNIFFLKSTSDNVCLDHIIEFYRNILIEKSGSLLNLIHNSFFVYEVNSRLSII